MQVMCFLMHNTGLSLSNPNMWGIHAQWSASLASHDVMTLLSALWALVTAAAVDVCPLIGSFILVGWPKGEAFTVEPFHAGPMAASQACMVAPDVGKACVAAPPFLS